MMSSQYKDSMVLVASLFSLGSAVTTPDTPLQTSELLNASMNCGSFLFQRAVNFAL